MRTPWGVSDSTERCAPGVSFVTTPGHGGVMVSKNAAFQLTEQARSLGEPFGNYLAFDEYCRWAAIGYEHPEWLSSLWKGMSQQQIKEQAKHILRRWYPAYFGEAAS